MHSTTLNLITAGFAIAAAGLWLASALVKVPDVVTDVWRRRRQGALAAASVAPAEPT